MSSRGEQQQCEQNNTQGGQKQTKRRTPTHRVVAVPQPEHAVKLEPAVQHELALHVGVHARVVKHAEAVPEAAAGGGRDGQT